MRTQVERFLVDAHQLPGFSVAERIEVVERTVAFVAEILLPRADAEERVLYPQASMLLGERSDGEVVARDWHEVRHLMAELAACDVNEPGRLQEILYAFHALLESHFWRGDALYVRLLAARPQRRVRELLDRVGAVQRRRRFASRRAPMRA